MADVIFERLELQANIAEEDEVVDEKNKKKETVVKDMKSELQHFIDTSLSITDVVHVTNSIDGDFKLYDAQKQNIRPILLDTPY